MFENKVNKVAPRFIFLVCSGSWLGLITIWVDSSALWPGVVTTSSRHTTYTISVVSSGWCLITRCVWLSTNGAIAVVVRVSVVTNHTSLCILDSRVVNVTLGSLVLALEETKSASLGGVVVLGTWAESLLFLGVASKEDLE